jgi:hypothetical protein
MFGKLIYFGTTKSSLNKVMNTKLIFTLLAFGLLGAAKAQHFDKTKVKSKNQSYNVKNIKETVFLNNEKNIYIGYGGIGTNYKTDTLNLSGLSLKEAHIEVIEKVKKYLTDERGLSLETLPNILTTWKILNTGQVKEVMFSFPKDSPLTPQDFEEMEKIITQTKVKVTQPKFYKSVNYIPITIVLRWKPIR